MTLSPSSGALYGIRARLRGHVQQPPQIRYAADGTEMLEFTLRLVDGWPPDAPASELIVVRYGGQQRELMQWLAYGRHVVLEGVIHLVRWTGKTDGKDRARLLLEATEIEPLDQERPDPSRAAVTAPRPPQPSVGTPPSETERLERLRALADSTVVEERPKKAPTPRDTARIQRLSRRYEEIFGGDAA